VADQNYFTLSLGVSMY